MVTIKSKDIVVRRRLRKFNRLKYFFIQTFLNRNSKFKGENCIKIISAKGIDVHFRSSSMNRVKTSNNDGL